MQIQFAGTIIARGPLDGGTDAIVGFVPPRKPTVQWAEPTRATDAIPYARGNRKRTLSGSITPAPYASPGAALQAALTWEQALPDGGALVITEGGLQTVFANAVMSIDSIVRTGVTLVISLSFSVGAGTTGRDLFNKDGVTGLVNKDGATPLQNKS